MFSFHYSDRRHKIHQTLKTDQCLKYKGLASNWFQTQNPFTFPGLALQFFQKGIGVGVRALRAGCDEELENGSPGGSEEHHGPIAMWACFSVHHHSVQLVP